MKVYPAAALANAPETFKSVDAGKLTSKFGEKVTNPTTGKLKLDSADKSDTVSFAKNAVSKELGENRFKQLVKKVGAEKATAMLEKAEEGFKENYALLKKLSEM